MFGKRIPEASRWRMFSFGTSLIGSVSLLGACSSTEQLSADVSAMTDREVRSAYIDIVGIDPPLSPNSTTRDVYRKLAIEAMLDDALAAAIAGDVSRCEHLLAVVSDVAPLKPVDNVCGAYTNTGTINYNGPNE